MIDLHVHTNASSDGVHTPEEIFERARRVAGKTTFDAIAFADHNSVDNIESGLLLSKAYGIPFVTAVELGSYHGGQDIHILGYFIDPLSAVLTDFLTQSIEETTRQTEERVRLLNGLGFALDVSDVSVKSAGRAPTGRTFLEALSEREENRDDRRLKRYRSGDRADSPSLNFYLNFLAGGKPAYVALSGFPVEKAIAVVEKSGGVPILAHPGAYPDSIVEDVIARGVAGLEAYSGHHNERTSRRFVELCEKRSLIWTAGSDFHGKEVKPNIELGVSIENGRLPYDRLREEYLKRNA